MKISNSGYFSNQTSIKKPSKSTSQASFRNTDLNLCPISNLNKAAIHFTALKKSALSGIDLMMVNQLRAPIQNFNKPEDFQNYCQNILDKKYLNEEAIEKFSQGIDEQATTQKEAILREWINYITTENEAYTPAIQLMILSSITKDLSPTTDRLPPILDKRKLADTISEIAQKSKNQRNYSCNFDKLYRHNLVREVFQSEDNIDENLNGWIVIPSKTNDPENFLENVKKLQILSCDTWCTKSFNAEPYLSIGDFHIYFEKGKPKLGLRFKDDTLEEIQGEKNNKKVPFAYIEILESYISQQGIKTGKEPNGAMAIARRQKEFYDKIGDDVVKSKDIAQILPHYGFTATKDQDGYLTLSSFVIPPQGAWPLELSEINIKEEDVFAQTKRVKDSVFLYGSSTGELEEVGGDLEIDADSTIKTLGKVKRINSDLLGSCAFDLKSLGDLRYVGQDVELPRLKDFKDKILELEYIGGSLIFENASFERPNLLLSSTPLSRPITVEEYQMWRIDKQQLSLDEIQKKINDADIDAILDALLGEPEW